jgi:FMN phosphatase YigB (HAD superfamily)
MPLRIGFDMDGVLADFARSFREVEERLFGPGERLGVDAPEQEEEAQEKVEAAAAKPDGVPAPDFKQLRRRRDLIWRDIQGTANFWESLKPIDETAVARIHELMLRHRWEVFFITQRPRTDGDTVQRQTQRWLVQQGFDLPSVLVLGGSRGAAAGALRLTYHVDDSAQNCIDVIAESRARPILVVPDSDETTVASARKLGIGTARSIAECLDILDQATVADRQPGVLARLASLVGWR